MDCWAGGHRNLVEAMARGWGSKDSAAWFMPKEQRAGAHVRHR